MSSNQGNNSGPNTNTGPQNAKRRRQILKNDATAIEWSVGAWSAALYVLASFFIEHHPWASAAIFVAAAIASIFVVFIQFRHVRHGKRRISWLPTIGLVVAHLVAVGTASVLLIAPDLFAAQTFEVVRSEWYWLGHQFKDGSTPYASISRPLPDGTIIKGPLDVLIFVEIHNNKAEKRLVRSYHLEAEFDGNWKRLCRTEMDGNPPHFINDKGEAVPISLKPPMLSEANSSIEPNATTAFWSAWTCSWACNVTPHNRLRMIVTELDGHSEALILTGTYRLRQEFDAETKFGFALGVQPIPASQIRRLTRGPCSTL
jgi:hypothetical protein